jgi:glycosyltransferase involved in cell wall biosynthesis
VPHLYDMHSSLPQQLGNFKYSRSRLLRWLFQIFERSAVRRSRVVIVICAELERVVREIDPASQPVLDRERAGRRRERHAARPRSRPRRIRVTPATPLVVYTGTFEAYQGLDLLFDAAMEVVRARPEVRFLLAGGRRDQLERTRRDLARLGSSVTSFWQGSVPRTRFPRSSTLPTFWSRREAGAPTRR